MNGGELTYQELVTACRNVGIDLTCGGCATAFYTGTNAPHDTHCTTTERAAKICEEMAEEREGRGWTSDQAKVLREAAARIRGEG